MAFYGDGLEVVGIDGMIGAFPEQVEAVFLQVADEVTLFDTNEQSNDYFCHSERGEESLL